MKKVEQDEFNLTIMTLFWGLENRLWWRIQHQYLTVTGLSRFQIRAPKTRHLSSLAFKLNLIFRKLNSTPWWLKKINSNTSNSHHHRDQIPLSLRKMILHQLLGWSSWNKTNKSASQKCGDGKSHNRNNSKQENTTHLASSNISYGAASDFQSGMAMEQIHFSIRQRMLLVPILC